MDKQITNICCGKYFHLKKIGSICRLLPLRLLNSWFMPLYHHAWTTAVLCCQAFQTTNVINSKGCKTQLLELWPKCDHISPVLYKLHWLPVKFWIPFKIALLVNCTFHSLASDYLSELINAYQPCCALRSADKLLLAVPFIRLKSYGERSFAFSAVQAWNTLPHSIQTS